MSTVYWPNWVTAPSIPLAHWRLQIPLRVAVPKGIVSHTCVVEQTVGVPASTCAFLLFDYVDGVAPPHAFDHLKGNLRTGPGRLDLLVLDLN